MKPSGANGMTEGDRVLYVIDGRIGTAKEFLQDGDATVEFDGGSIETVKWSNLILLPFSTAARLRKAGLHTHSADDEARALKSAAYQRLKDHIAHSPRESTPSHGKRNIYTCEQCWGHIVTVDLVEGVTPFMLKCEATPGCQGMMQSSMYRVFDQRMAPTHEWYKPIDMETLKRWELEHVAKGGLLLRRRVQQQDPSLRNTR